MRHYPDVADAALRALRETRRAREVELLVQAYESEADHQRRWILIDALAGMGDPGDEGNGRPSWPLRVAERASADVRRYLAARIDDARKEAKKEADRQDERQR